MKPTGNRNVGEGETTGSSALCNISCQFHHFSSSTAEHQILIIGRQRGEHGKIRAAVAAGASYKAGMHAHSHKQQSLLMQPTFSSFQGFTSVLPFSGKLFVAIRIE